MRRLDEFDPKGDKFGIKADVSWTDFDDRDIERALREEKLMWYFPSIFALMV